MSDKNFVYVIKNRQEGRKVSKILLFPLVVATFQGLFDEISTNCTMKVRNEKFVCVAFTNDTLICG